jgi:hypothetical protein
MFDQILNSSDIRREELDGTEYVVAPTTLLKPMYLNVPGNWSVNEAYLPQQEAKASIPSWNGTPLTLNHPTQNGAGTTANSPEMHQKSVLGRVFNAEWENGEVVGEAWFNVPKIREMGGMAENALERVLNGGGVEVSTGYRASKLPSGEYDGETHTAVQGNLKPDHLAVLPNKQGKCSIASGCGVGEPVANSLIVTNAEMIHNQDVPDEYQFDNPGEAMEAAQDLGLDDIHTHGDGEDTVFMPGEDMDTLLEALEMAENVLSEARTPTYDGTETQSWADVSKDLEAWADALDVDADTVGEMTADEKATVAEHTLLGDADAETWQELSFFPVVNPNTGDLNRGALMAVLSGRGAQADIPEDTLSSARSVAERLLDDEFDAENSGHMDEMSENALYRLYSVLKGVVKNSDGNEPAESGVDKPDEPKMNDKTQELVDNHGFKAENLPDEETECFSTIYNRFVAADSTETETEPETADNVKEITESELEELISNRVDERLDEREAQSEKERLASDIAANSTEYESAEAVLEDYPTEAALNTKQKDVAGNTPNFANTVGADAKPATNDEDADDLTMFGSDA